MGQKEIKIKKNFVLNENENNVAKCVRLSAAAEQHHMSVLAENSLKETKQQSSLKKRQVA